MSKARDIADLNVTILDSVESGATADQTNAEIRTAVEAATDSNVFTDADHTKLNSIDQGVATGDSPTFVDVTATSLDISGDIDVDGTTNLDVVDIDGAVDMASTLAVAGAATFNAGAVFANNTVHYGNGNAAVDWGNTSTVGQLSFSGTNAIIRSSVSDSDMIFQGNDGGSFITALQLDMSNAGRAYFPSGGGMSVEGSTVFNDAGADVDFRVESDTNANGLMLDASTSTVGVNRAASSVVALSVNAGATNSSTYAFEACNANNNTKFIVRSDGYSGFYKSSNAGGFIHNTNGAITITPDAGGHFVFNEDGVDADFRVESNSFANMLFVDGGNNCVSAGGGNSPAGSNWGFYAEGQTKDTSSNTYTAAKFASAGYVDTGEYTTMLGMGVEKGAYWSKGGMGFTRTAGYDVGYLGFYVNGAVTNATLTLADEVLRLTPSEVVVNDRSRSTVDFRVESDTSPYAFFVDASSGTVNVGGATAGPGAQSGIALSGVNTDSNIYVRHANGTGSGSRYMAFTYNTSELGSISQHGTSQVLFNVSSDQRLKENIADADDAGSKIDAIQVRKYDWKADGLHQDYGMIAQELQAVVPQAVSGDADSEDMMGVDYSKLVPMLVKEIQSLRQRVASLEE